jgi:hypothetical protein
MNILQEIKRLRVEMNEAYDNGDPELGDYLIDEIDILAKIYNSGLSYDEYQRWVSSNEYLHEYNPLPEAIREEVIDVAKNSKLTKELVDKWNTHLDFDLHEKLKTYGFVGSARLYKIFSLK